VAEDTRPALPERCRASDLARHGRRSQPGAARTAATFAAVVETVAVANTGSVDTSDGNAP
jgi:hypothetical protein